MKALIIINALAVLVQGQNGQSQFTIQQSLDSFVPAIARTCLEGTDQSESFYQAPARAVPLPPVDPQLKREFLNLFHRDTNPSHNHSDPHDIITDSTQPSVIDPAIIAQINANCPRDSFFYSFAPRHMNATMLLQQVFLNLSTPQEVLRVARAELYRHEINPRVWYYALVGTFIMRPDLNGYQLAWPIDSTPDLYVPNTIINSATQGSSRPPPMIDQNQCQGSNGQQYTDFRIRLPQPTRTGRQSQRQRFKRASPELKRSKRQSNFGFFSNNQGGYSTSGTNQLVPPARTQSFQNQFSITKSLQTPANTHFSFNRNQQQSFSNQFSAPRTPSLQTSNRFSLLQSQSITSSNRFSAPVQPTISTGNRFAFTRNQQQTLRQPPPPIRQSQPQGRRRDCIRYSGTNGATFPENRLWYFREDMMLNQHHWYWHQFYPQSSIRHPDRRGEVFYFTHHNIIARYNAERLSNGLGRESALDLRLGGNIGSGYNSDLVDKQSGRFWTPREANTLLSDINHGSDPDFMLNATMQEIADLYGTLVYHIAEGVLLSNTSLQGQINIRNQEGLNHLGNTIEAAEELSTHAQFYHRYGVHNLGHISIALSTDPDFRCRRPTGVMAELSVTMRDPAFYKVHTFVDDLFYQYKDTLDPYQLIGDEWPLVWDGVEVTGVELESDIKLGTFERKNYVRTFWSSKRFPLEEGVDGAIHDGDVEQDICHQHLNHEPFTFRITVDIPNCVESSSKRGTVRLFMAPRFDVDGRRFGMEETRRLMFMLDAFPVDLKRGRNIITRRSRDSSSTKPWSRTLQEMLRDPENSNEPEYCGCGWPHHLYLPKGNNDGMDFDLFVMITNFDEDQVQDRIEDQQIPEPCNSPYIFCGVPYRRYPDARPLGYPFDRMPYSIPDGGQNFVSRPVRDLEEYVAQVPNMGSSIVTIQHLNTRIWL